MFCFFLAMRHVRPQLLNQGLNLHPTPCIGGEVPTTWPLRKSPCNYYVTTFLLQNQWTITRGILSESLVQFLSARPQNKYPVMEKWTNVLGIPFLSFESEESVSGYTVLSHPERSVLIEKNFRRWTSSHQLFCPVFSCLIGGISTESHCAFEPDYASHHFREWRYAAHSDYGGHVSLSSISPLLLTHQSISVRLQPVKKLTGKDFTYVEYV